MNSCRLTPSSFPAKKAAFSIPANTTASILLDQTFYTNAYPTLIFSGGENSQITITYAESLRGENGAKNNRNGIEEKTISGRQDIIVSDGTDNQNFTSLSYRTYRYVELKIETKETSLIIENFYGTFTGYPFTFNARLNTDDAEIGKIMEIGWRTARSCAVDTYMDCPYYERLQYIGDARIQFFVSYYNSGDDRLIKNGLNLMDYSRQRDRYLDWLDVWRKNIELGLTTWGETSEVERTRSDCHAWGSSPNIEFFRIVLGIESDAFYFEKVKIEPHLGSMKQISGEMPHPNGKISVRYRQEGSHWNVEITLPDETTGTFYWQGESHPLQRGLNTFEL